MPAKPMFFKRRHRSGKGMLDVQRYSDCFSRPGAFALAAAAPAADKGDIAPAAAATIPRNAARRLTPVSSSDMPVSQSGIPAQEIFHQVPFVALMKRNS